MQEKEHEAYIGLKKQGAFLVQSPKFGLVVVSMKLPNLTVILLFRIPVTISEYRNQHQYVPKYYRGPSIQEQQAEYYQQDTDSDKLSEVILLRRNWGGCQLTCLIWPDIRLIYLNTNLSIYSVRFIQFYPKNQTIIGVIRYSTQNLRHPNLRWNIIVNLLFMASYFRFTIRNLKITGKNINRGPTSGIVTAKRTI